MDLGKLPSEMPAVERTWRTRQDPFEAHWPEVKQRLEDAPELEAKILFEHLCETYPGHYQESQLRTLQRRIKHWRATQGPDKEVFYAHICKGSETDSPAIFFMWKQTACVNWSERFLQLFLFSQCCTVYEYIRRLPIAVFPPHVRFRKNR